MLGLSLKNWSFTTLTPSVKAFNHVFFVTDAVAK
jgi:hypothetical protein